jgi:hypothetical protein
MIARRSFDQEGGLVLGRWFAVAVRRSLPSKSRGSVFHKLVPLLPRSDTFESSAGASCAYWLYLVAL